MQGIREDLLRANVFMNGLCVVGFSGDFQNDVGKLLWLCFRKNYVLLTSGAVTALRRLRTRALSVAGAAQDDDAFEVDAI